MSRQRLERTQVVPGALGEVFQFFEDPRNLEIITPPWLGFRILEATDSRVQEGTEIRYALSWNGVPLRWRSRIVEYEPNASFSDEMLEGPYRSWVHRHAFREVEGGVEMRDRVDYALPLGPLGDLVHRALVRRQLSSIFDFREKTIRGIFAEPLRAQGR